MRFLIVGISWLMLSGCTALLVGGAAVGGYQVGKDERPAGVVASDSAITTRIKGKYVADSEVSVFNIGVRTYEGNVILNGTVGSFAARSQAEKLARETPGVIAVNNLVVVQGEGD
jgi:hyperosmotically inducible protein